MLNQLIYLVKCAVNSTIPDLHDIDYEQLYQESVRHQLVSTIAYALESAGIYHPLFTKGKEKATMRLLLMEVDREAVFIELEKAGIWYMPLKGIILKNYYPQVKMREMADNDILFDPARADDVRTIMENLGFNTIHFGEIREDDNYHKPPSSNFEMHRNLVHPNRESLKQINQYYQNVKDRLICVHGYEYRFSLEDFYIYNIVHEYKHYCNGGTGIRSLLDTYVFLKKEKPFLDWNYLKEEFNKIGLAKFEDENQKLAFALFDEGQLSDDQKNRLKYMYESGVYGIKDHVIQNNINKQGKFRYLLKSFIVPFNTMKKQYPLFYRYRILLPLLPFYRLIKNRELALKIIKWLIHDKKS